MKDRHTHIGVVELQLPRSSTRGGFPARSVFEHTRDPSPRRARVSTYQPHLCVGEVPAQCAPEAEDERGGERVELPGRTLPAGLEMRL